MLGIHGGRWGIEGLIPDKATNLEARKLGTFQRRLGLAAPDGIIIALMIIGL